MNGRAHSRGIRPDTRRGGWRVYVKVGTGKTARQIEEHFPAGTSLKKMQDRRAELRRQLLKKRPLLAPGSLNAAIADYVARIQALVSWVEIRSCLRAWAQLYGSRQVSTLTPADIDHAVSRWATQGVAPKTINHRALYLRRMWRVLWPGADCPADHFRPLPVHKTPPRVIDAGLVTRVLEQLTDAKAAARLMVIAACGRRPSEVMRAQPDDVDLGRRIWIPRDGKGGWSPGVYLNDDMLVAWMTFAQVDAWGPFNESYWVEKLKEAGWPTEETARGVRANPPPYQLRHSVGLLMSERGVDLADIQAHMGHRNIATTRRHYVPVLGSRMQQASELLAGRFGFAPASLPAFSGSTGAKAGKSGTKRTVQFPAQNRGKSKVS